MDDGSLTPSNNPPTEFGSIDYDIMDQLLDEGCWLQTADGSNLQGSGPGQGQVQGISTSSGLTMSYLSHPMFRSLEPNYSNLTSSDQPCSSNQNWNPKSEQQEPDSECQENHSAIGNNTNQSSSFCWEDNELKQVLWISPKGNSAHSSVKDRLVQAVSNLKELNRDRDVLIQIWVPVKKGLKTILTTVEQPHFYQSSDTRLVLYRNVSEKYEFIADEDSKEALGLPGRVFLGKAPEWTSDVRLFREDEYPRIDYARKYDVRGSIALPVFEKGSGDSLGVVEIIMTTENFDYRPEVESVCKALETVHLRSSEILNTYQEQVGKGVDEAIHSEILTVLKSICDTFDLPLAQTWAPCSQQGKSGCWHSDNNANCVSTVDSLSYVQDQRVKDFHKACLEHHLLKQHGGIVGKAFTLNQPCYATDVTAFSKVECPLSHHAKVFGLHGAVALRLRGIYHEVQDYVLELYLPLDIQETGLAFHYRICQTVSLFINQHCRYLQFMTDKEVEQKAKEISWLSQMMEPQRKGKEVANSLEFGEEPSRGFKVMNWSNSETSLQLGPAIFDGENINSDYSGSKDRSGSSSGGRRTPPSARKTGDKRRSKTQKTISLDILQQHFAGSLKDAAKAIGVCPTTLKRICRQHGISRWPSRKLKKVDHSLRKLQLVIDSVQGAEGVIKLSSFYTKFPELNSPNAQQKPNQAPSINLNNQPNQKLSIQPEKSMYPSGATTSNSPASTSSSQTSTSSYCFSSGGKLSSSPVTTIASESKEVSPSNDPREPLKRARSEAELQVLCKKEATQILERSQSNRTLAEHPSFETLPPLPAIKSFLSREVGVFRAKATFGEEKVRFSILPNMGFQELQQQITKRFNLEDFSKMGIKYLDDDKEWVLLTCDEDLDECIDIHKSLGSHTIKLSVSVLSSLAGSVGSSGLS